MIALIRYAVEPGVTLFDTAEVYGPKIKDEIARFAVENRANTLVLEEGLPSRTCPPGPSTRGDRGQ